MTTCSYRLRFVTPAFLGNAEQVGQWRTPPIKALLRQFWRMAYAAEHGFNVDVAVMRREEGLLFGHVPPEGGRDREGRRASALKSAIRIRLGSTDQQPAWAVGSQPGVQPLSNGLDTSYAWFGLIKRGANLPDRKGIRADANSAESVRQLAMAYPASVQQRMDEVMSLTHNFGLLGSRSRGGWGALQIDGAKRLDAQSLRGFARDLDDCLRTDWAMSLAQDRSGLLLWESTRSFKVWPDAMRFIATQRKNVRTALKLGRDLRHALGFALPNSRMPSPLRWKVFADGPGQLRVRVFALPHGLPDSTGKQMSYTELHSAWSTASNTLDGVSDLKRIG